MGNALFSFRGTVTRGQMWLIYFGVGLVGTFFVRGFIFIGQSASDPAFTPNRVFGLPLTWVGWTAFVGYWLVQFMAFWVIAAAVAKRLREVGIAVKWLVIFAILMVVFVGSMSHLVHDGDTHIPPLAWILTVFVGFPTAVIGFWVFGSVFLAPSRPQRQFDPANLPDGWK